MTGRRVFLYSEYIRMITAENIVTAYRSSSQAANWANWAGEHPQLADILSEAMELTDG